MNETGAVLTLRLEMPSPCLSLLYEIGVEVGRVCAGTERGLYFTNRHKRCRRSPCDFHGMCPGVWEPGERGWRGKTRRTYETEGGFKGHIMMAALSYGHHVCSPHKIDPHHAPHFSQTYHKG